ncbi:hypothetical protein V5E97_23750 [Singulisphaera sp. Ch08]|uniref:Chromosome partition protein Smc n=1 Tax=Singulisphaera sp. Ch08 TaxID=3120278 RepID=A0AAU7C873_9BACT
MSVYIRYPCPNCSQHLSLRLEYVNRRVVCNFCQHPFLSRAKVRVPASATTDLMAAIHATNRAQGFLDSDSERSDELVVPPPMEFGEVRDHPQLELSGMGETSGLRSRGSEIELALAEAEARRFEQSQMHWQRERQDLEDEIERLAVRHSQQLEAILGERDDALRRVEESVREQTELAQRVAVAEAARDGLLEERLATAAAFDRLAARVGELELTLGEARSRHAEELSARREEERRAMAQAAERLARERDNSSEQLRDVLAQLEDALAQLEIARRQGAAEWEAMRRELEVARSSAISLDVSRELPSRLELERSQAEVERLAEEVERARAERDAESRRCKELAERVNERDGELERIRLAHEAEAQEHRLAVEELQLMLRYRPRPDLQPSGDPATADSGADGMSVDASPGDSLVVVGPGSDNPLVAVPESSVELVTGPNPSDSPDERIAALRTYLRNAQEADKQRISKGLLRRLVRGWRHGKP